MIIWNTPFTFNTTFIKCFTLIRIIITTLYKRSKDQEDQEEEDKEREKRTKVRIGVGEQKKIETKHMLHKVF